MSTATAEYIAKVLGGAGAIRVMTGCKVFAIENGNGLQLSGLKCRAKFNYVNIVYNAASDLFDVTFTKIVKFNVSKQEVSEGVYVEQLKSLVESKTGLFLTL